jgi:type II secretory pathway pseudopilin PulG
MKKLNMILRPTRCGFRLHPNFRLRAFVLLELIIIMGLLLILFVTYWGRGSIQNQRKKQQACRQNLQLVYLALQNYALDHDLRLPTEATAKTSEEPLSLLVPKYTTRSDIFICPGSKHSRIPQGESFRRRKISYSYLSGLKNESASGQWVLADWLIRAQAFQAGDQIFSSDGKGPGNNHDKFGGVILLMDGSAEITGPTASINLELPKGTKILNPNR